jgi:dinuclear metal center YbgI/SA1388 family protein
MPNITAIAAFLEEIAPIRLAEEWDNVGLLVGRRERDVKKLMTCLTVTPESAAEAIEAGVDLIVTHHPMPFRPVQQVTDDTTVGRILLDLIAANIAIYSSHTAFDSAAGGVNDRIAAGLDLCDILPLIPHSEGQGAGRRGRLEKPIALGDLGKRLKAFLSIEHLQVVGQPERIIHSVAIGCGAADELLGAAQENGCDAMILGEARFHTCLEAQATGMGLLLPGHYASERFAMVCLANILGREFPDVEVWASRRENDPIEWK